MPSDRSAASHDTTPGADQTGLELEVQRLLRDIHLAATGNRSPLADDLAAIAPRVPTAVAAALRSKDWKARWAAAHAIGKSRVTVGHSDLRALLQDPQ